MTATGTSSCRWAIYAYSWKQMYPFKNSKNPGDSVPAIYVPGVTNLSFTRSKANPANQLTFTIRGGVHWSVRPGNWIILRSSVSSSVAIKGRPNQLSSMEAPHRYNFHADANSKSGLPRFIGQIAEVNTSYVMTASGAMQRTTQVMVNEWSEALNISVRFDDLVIARALDTSNGVVNTAALAQYVDSPEFAVDDMQTLASATYNAFEFAQLVLRFVGAISDSQQDNEDLAALNYSYPKVAATLPQIPSELMDDLGIDADGPDFFNLVQFVTGVQIGQIPGTQDKFHGIYPQSVVDDMTASEDDGNPYFNRRPDFRPLATNKVQLLYQGVPAWQVLEQSIDSAFNEVFTDFLYTFSNDGNGQPIVGAQPVIWVRDRPLTLQSEADKWTEEDPDSTNINGLYTFYDDLPRISLSSVFIEQMSIVNSCKTSPNFIRINYTGEDASQFAGQYAAQSAYGRGIYKPGEMARFGGHEFSVETTYVTLMDTDQAIPGIASQEDFEAFVKTLRNVVDSWNTQLYKFASVSLSIKDPGHPLCVGHNLQWDFGLNDDGSPRLLLGHIETISTAAFIDAEGAWHTETGVQLSRVVDASYDSLDYIPIHEMFNLIGERFAIDPRKYDTDDSPVDPAAAGAASAILNSVVSSALEGTGIGSSNSQGQDPSEGIPYAPKGKP